MRRNITRAALLALALEVLPGCPSVISKLLPVVAEVINVAAEANGKLDQLDALANQAFRERPNPALEKRWRLAMATARGTVAAMHAAAKGTEQLDRQAAAAAFDQFKIAYTQLSSMFDPLGISAGAGMLRASPDSAPQPFTPPLATSFEVPQDG